LHTRSAGQALRPDRSCVALKTLRPGIAVDTLVARGTVLTLHSLLAGETSRPGCTGDASRTLRTDRT
jgi:hypothetical protein